MRELFYGIGAAALVGLAFGGMMKPDPVQSRTRDGSMVPVAQGYGYDDPVSYAPAVAPAYYDTWSQADRALLQSASYDTGDADFPSYDPRPAPEDRAEAIRLTAEQDDLAAPPPDATTARYPSAQGDILGGLTPHVTPPPLPPTVSLGAMPRTSPRTSDDSATAGDTRVAPLAPAAAPAPAAPSAPVAPAAPSPPPTESSPS